jgi:hypothetical protein
MMKRVLKTFSSFCAAAVLLAVLSGCEKSVPRTDYFPLRDGNRWDYRLLDMPLLKRIEAGQTVDTSQPDADLSPKRAAAENASDSAAEFVDPKKPAPGKSEASATARRVVLELREAMDDQLSYRAVYDTAEQVWSKRNGYVGFQSIRGRNYLLILPPHTGYKWVVTDAGGHDLYYEIESAAAQVTTPAGAFRDCALARQESRDRKEIFKYWFAPNVGLVRRSKYFAGEEVFRQELVEYTVKPATPATRMAEDREVRLALEGKNHGAEFRELRKEDRDRRVEDLEPRENARVDEKVRKFADPK